MLSDRFKNIVIILIISLGVILKLFLTSNGHFIFHMDVARDFLDVREMITLHKLRLIGPTSAIKGVYDGPAWYYLLAIPFLLTGGHPYSAVVMMILFWAIGGYFLLKLTEDLGIIPMLTAGLLWLGSNYLQLATVYSFHPHMISLLTPLFIYLLDKYFKTTQIIYIFSVWLLAGAFFNFEMNFGVFMPLIIVVTTFFLNRKLLLKPSFWFTASGFLLFLLPQIVFDFKYNHMMSQALWQFTKAPATNINFTSKIVGTAAAFQSVWLPGLMNQKLIFYSFIGLMFYLLSIRLKFGPLPNLLRICSFYIFLPFLGFVFLPVTVASWHLGGIIAPTIIYFSFGLHQLLKNSWGKIIALLIFGFIIWAFLVNVSGFIVDNQKAYSDQSGFINEIEAIDYVYQQAQGKDFKVYSYLPSVYDFPYQYLIWWHGQKQFGYLPSEYRYAPNKPDYLAFQSKFQTTQPHPKSSLVFLIKEPDNPDRRGLWENSFKNFPLLNSAQLGPLTIETRQDLTNY